MSVSTDEDAVWNTRYVRVISDDQQFELPPDQIRIINIEVFLTAENLANFADDTMVFTATLMVEATDDNAQISMQFSADKYVAEESSSDGGWLWCLGSKRRHLGCRNPRHGLGRRSRTYLSLHRT